ncbi:MAG TPA: acetamidase/formamidase family protein [Roseiarcus sp.]|nr:acetamidase/formamidase family protein [Roseiarcus sp.]
MARHVCEPVILHNALGSFAPMLRIADGDAVVAETVDAWGFDKAGARRHTPPNPMTGPFYVEGAEPGDSLAVRIDRMTPNRGEGWTFGPVAANVVDPAAVAALPKRERVLWRLDGEVARLIDPPAALAHFEAPLAPMLGCFGVAPPLGQAISTATSGPYGGNMDYRRFGPGATAYFPVFAPGALFFLGDGHFCQGDGEIVGTGIETSFEVEFTVSVQKGRTIGWPRGETQDFIFALGNARPLDQALQHATSEMMAWLAADYGLDALAASHVLGQAVRYDVANVFNPAYSVACRLSKRVLAALAR